MRCLYCGKQLALFRRLTGSGEFCSDAHKQSYHEEYNRLALTRLIAAQSKSEEIRALSPNANAATPRSEGGGPRALPEARPGNLHQRWGDLSRSANARMLEAPSVEQPPPPAATFVITKLAAMSLKWGLPVELPVEPVTLLIVLMKPGWDPSLAEIIEKITPPPEADLLPFQLLPSAVAWEVPELPVGPVPEPFIVSHSPTVPKITVPLCATASLRRRPAVRIDPLEFAPAPATTPEPEERFEDFPFAVVFFSAPALNLVPRGAWSKNHGQAGPSSHLSGSGPTLAAFKAQLSGAAPSYPDESSAGNHTSERPRTQSGSSVSDDVAKRDMSHRIAAAVALAEEDSASGDHSRLDLFLPLQIFSPIPRDHRSPTFPVEALITAPRTPLPTPNLIAAPPSIAGAEARPPSSIKMKLAALGAPTPEEAKPASLDKRIWRAEAPSRDPGKSKDAEETAGTVNEPAEKPRPKLPTIPAMRRRSSYPMPSILDPEPESNDDRNRSLWGAIRKYIKR